MNAIAHSGRQIQLIKHTIAGDCNDAEFDLFMEAARSYGLDPFRKQILPLVFGKNAKDQSKRRMSIVVSRDGLRVIAQRCKNYRPASEPAQFVFDPDLVGPTNPKGIVSVSVRLWQQDNRGEWFPVMGEADWDEFAPLTDEWAEGDDGKRRPTGEKVLDRSGNWARMPKVMLAKCAEAQALRAGWPDQFGGIYVEEEMDKARTLDLTATEIVAAEEEDRRMKAVAANDAITVTWGDNYSLENVPVGHFMDRALEHLDGLDALGARKWADANREPLRLFWARHPSDALELKKVIEAKTQQASKLVQQEEFLHPVMAG